MITIEPIDWDSGADALRAIREAVFVAEQGVPPTLEYDGEDPAARHWLLRVEGAAAGCARMLADGHIGRLALLPDYRGRGLGRRLMQRILDDAAAMGLEGVHLNAQVPALAFYHRLGFESRGPEFDDAGIPHRHMQLKLARRLGASSGRFAVSDIGTVGLELARQCRRCLRLLSLHLEARWFDRREWAQALSALARRHRNTEIRLLIADSRPLVGTHHALLGLTRRLPSSVLLRRTRIEPHELRDLFVIADERGLLRWPAREPERAWADFNNRPAAEDAAARFDGLWYRSVDDPELRDLHI